MEILGGHPSAGLLREFLEESDGDAREYQGGDPRSEIAGVRLAIGYLQDRGSAIPNCTALLAELESQCGGCETQPQAAAANDADTA